jgi:hypothetical protein
VGMESFFKGEKWRSYKDHQSNSRQLIDIFQCLLVREILPIDARGSSVHNFM